MRWLERPPRVERDERDLGLVDDGEDATPGMGDAGVEVMEPAAAPEGHGALAVGDVIAEAEVAAAPEFDGSRLRRRPIRLARCRPANRTVRPLLVVGEAEGVELAPGAPRGSSRPAAARASA